MKILGMRGLLHLLPSHLKEGEVLIANSSMDVFLLLSHQHFAKNTDKGQNKEKAQVARQKYVEKASSLPFCCSQKSQNPLQNTGIKK